MISGGADITRLLNYFLSLSCFVAMRTNL